MKNFTYPGWQIRIQRTLIALPLIAIGFSLFFLTRIALTDQSRSDFVAGLWTSFLGVMLIVLVVGFFFYVFGGSRVQPIYWTTIFVSADVGLVVGAVLYVWPLRNLVLPQFHLSPATNLIQALAAVGMLDGMLAGAINGFVVTTLDAKASTLTFAGVTRYVSVSCFVMAAMIISQWVNQSSKLGNTISPFLFCLICLAIQWGMKWLDRKTVTTQ
jgi:hypothetical protein